MDRINDPVAAPRTWDTTQPRAESKRRYALRFIWGKYEGRSLQLPNEAEIYIGRDGRFDMVLAEESVSRTHAKLNTRHGRIVLTDLNSKNGTFVNGERVICCELRPSDEIAVGTSVMKVVCLGAQQGGDRDAWYSATAAPRAEAVAPSARAQRPICESAPPPVDALLRSVSNGETCLCIAPAGQSHVLALLRALAGIPAGRALLWQVLCHLPGLHLRFEAADPTHTQSDAAASTVVVGGRTVLTCGDGGRPMILPRHILLARALIRAHHRGRWPRLHRMLVSIPVAGYRNAEELAVVDGLRRGWITHIIAKHEAKPSDRRELSRYGAIGENLLRKQAQLPLHKPHLGCEIDIGTPWQNTSQAVVFA